VVQPLNLDPLARFLLSRIEGRERLFIEERRLAWREAWSSAVAFDIGMAIYLNPAPQFQHMGLSSNRLCMFLAMGVPVIGNRQPSFEFLEKFDCGVLIDSYDEFMRAILYIRDNLDKMRANCKKCFNQYIKANDKFSYIKTKIDALT
jgi:glycosyltransferase involved in cell wall biosynthesis